MWWVLNEATVDSALLDALEQFEDQATNRLLLSALEGCKDPETSLMYTTVYMYTITVYKLL